MVARCEEDSQILVEGGAGKHLTNCKFIDRS